MNKQTEALKLALKALEQARGALAYVAVGNATENPNLARSTCSHGVFKIDKVEPVIREALAEQPAIKQDLTPEQPAQPQQELVKVGRITDNIKGMVLRQEVMLYTDNYLPIGTALYTSPAQRKPLTMQPIIKDPHGVLRFKKNGLVDALYEHGVKTGLGLNELHRMDFTDEDRQQFAQLIGYSVSGYGSLSYVTDEAYESAEQAAHDIKGDS